MLRQLNKNLFGFQNYPGSPSWSSKSSHCCSSSTRISHGHSSCKLSAYSDTIKSDSTNVDHPANPSNASNTNEFKFGAKSEAASIRSRPARRDTLSSGSSGRTGDLALASKQTQVAEHQQHHLHHQQGGRHQSLHTPGTNAIQYFCLN